VSLTEILQTLRRLPMLEPFMAGSIGFHKVRRRRASGGTIALYLTAIAQGPRVEPQSRLRAADPSDHKRLRRDLAVAKRGMKRFDEQARPNTIGPRIPNS
jgi:hypothetical protein